jgi:hypothetical protein
LGQINLDNDHEQIFQIFRFLGSFYAQESPPSPIPFIPKVKKMDKVDELDTDKSGWIKLDFPMDPDNPT